MKTSPPKSVSLDEAQKNLLQRPPCKLAQVPQSRGKVKIRLLIDQKGEVAAAKVMSGPSMLYSAAMNCVEHSKYRPFLQDGQPVMVLTEVDIKFPPEAVPRAIDSSYETSRAAANKALALGELDKAAELYQKDVDIAKSRQPKMQLEIAEASGDLGHVRMRQGKYDDAEKLLRQSIEAYEADGASDSPQVGRAAEELGSVYLGKKEYVKAVPLFSRAVTIFTRERTHAASPEMKKLISVGIERALFGLAAAKFQSSDLPAASSYCDQSIKEAADSSVSNAELKRIFTNCAGVKRALGQKAQADELQKRAEAIQERPEQP